MAAVAGWLLARAHPPDMMMGGCAAVWCMYGATTACFGVPQPRNCTVRGEGSDVRTVVNGFVLLLLPLLEADRGLECARIAKISPKKLGDYNCLITGI